METTGQRLTPETLDYLVLSDGRIPLQIKPQKTDKITYVAQQQQAFYLGADRLQIH
jgi:hypothetical protein